MVLGLGKYKQQCSIYSFEVRYWEFDMRVYGVYRSLGFTMGMEFAFVCWKPSRP